VASFKNFLEGVKAWKKSEEGEGEEEILAFIEGKN